MRTDGGVRVARNVVSHQKTAGRAATSLAGLCRVEPSRVEPNRADVHCKHKSRAAPTPLDETRQGESDGSVRRQIEDARATRRLVDWPIDRRHTTDDGASLHQIEPIKFFDNDNDADPTVTTTNESSACLSLVDKDEPQPAHPHINMQP